MTAVSVASLFTLALLGRPCSVVGERGHSVPLPVEQWQRPADADDLSILDLCVGSTLDIGCGPGRMVAALTERGHVALGIDVVPEAVGQTVRRGASALHRDVFGEVPGEGRWASALLADGNIGIGGDPVALLRRVRALIDPRGRCVVELAAPGVRSRTAETTLECEGAVSVRFPWSVVSVDDIEGVAARAGLALATAGRHGTRWCAVLREPT